jgi:hypothetical protein
MTRIISIIGIDGSGKSTLTPALADLAAAELGVTTACVGDDVRCKTPDEDLLLPGFAPEGELLAARLARLFRRGAKAAVGFRRLYPLVKLAHFAAQEGAVRSLAARYRPGLIFCDGSLILSSLGRALNYTVANADGPRLDPLSQIEALCDHVLHGAPLLPSMPRIPGLSVVRLLRRLDQWLHLGLLTLPDAVIFLDLAPETALARRRASGVPLDPHENLRDLAQAQTMYRAVVAFFRQRLGDENVIVIDPTHLSLAETLNRAMEFVRAQPIRAAQAGAAGERLGTTKENLDAKTSVIKKVLTVRYLARYFFPHLTRGSAQELTFPLSSLGRLLLREGYSAGVMKAIYQQNERRYGLLDRAFLGYPLHTAVYDRLRILQCIVENDLHRRLMALPEGGALRILTAPSGYAFDLLLPLARLAQTAPEWMSRVHLIASDLDPDGGIERELTEKAKGLGINFEFVRGDLTSEAMQTKLEERGPYDVVVFVGLSAWISKPHLIRHLRLICARWLAPGGVLFTDCFTPAAYALSGKYVGYKANYYTPRDFSALLAYAGFDPAGLTWESGRARLNHVCAARVRPPDEPQPLSWDTSSALASALFRYNQTEPCLASPHK